MTKFIKNASSNQDNKKQYYRGTVIYYKPKDGYGAILPDEMLIEQGELYFHHRSLREPQYVFQQGDRVLFFTSTTSNGLRADDVHNSQVYFVSLEDIEFVPGRIQSFDAEKKTGSILLEGSQPESVFFHASAFQASLEAIKIGTVVSLRFVTTAAGIEALEINLRDLETSVNNIDRGVEEDVTPKANDYLAQALLAKEQKRSASTIQSLYEKGMDSAPNLQLVLSYASWLRQIGRKSDAMKVYHRGIKVFPDFPKLREDAGTLASAMRKPQEALTLFTEALELARKQKKIGSVGTLLRFIGREYYNLGTQNGLTNAAKNFEEAQKLRRLDKNEILLLNLARLRVQHYRGELSYRFFVVQNNFLPVYAGLHEQRTIAGDLIVQSKNDELSQSYGLGNYIYIRVFFKQDITNEDLDNLNDTLARLANDNYVDEQTAFIVVASISPDLERVLRTRVERRAAENQPTIIPISQQDIEIDPNNILRNTLDDWIYKRDMFSGNQPVVGRRFFGREKHLKRIADAIDLGQCLGIFGLRKIGKTSLLKQSMHLSESNDIIIYKELSGVPAETRDVRYLYWEIANQLRAKLIAKFGDRESAIGKLRWRLGGVFEDYLDLADDIPVHAYFDSDLRRVLRAIRELKISVRPRIVILLDEIERLIPSPISQSDGFQDYYHFLGYVRAVNQEDNRFIVMVAGANPMISEIPQFEQKDNPVFNFFDEVYLPFLEQHECYEMIDILGRGMGIHFNHQAREKVFSLTGGHPFITRQFCSFVAAHHPNRPVTITQPDVVQQLEPYLLDRGDKDFREIMARLERDFPSEYDICLKIAIQGGTMPLKDIREYANKSDDKDIVRHLVGYQLLNTDSQRAYITIHLLTQWLRAKGHI